MKPDFQYPPPPWVLSGNGLIVLSLQALPETLPSPGLTAKCIYGNQTICGFYIGSYRTALTQESKSPWHEWGQVIGMVQYQKTKGLLIDAMGVDSEAALRGGQEIWGLNKFLGEIVYCDQHACFENNDGFVELKWKTYPITIWWNTAVAFLNQKNQDIIQYKVRIRGWFRFGKVDLYLNTHPHFQRLSVGSYWGIEFRDSSVRIDEPMKIS